jgi:hypothetical protein
LRCASQDAPESEVPEREVIAFISVMIFSNS